MVLSCNGDQVKLLDTLREYVEQSECLIEGGVKDKISHFMLRVICSAASEMSDFFVRAEMMLFEFRFSCSNQSELCKLLKSLDHHIKRVKRSNSKSIYYSTTVKQLLLNIDCLRSKWIKWNIVVEKYMKGEGECFEVPFQSVLPLVASREATLKKGAASVPVCKVRQVITYWYSQMLRSEVQTAARVFHTEDERIIDLIKIIQLLYRRSFRDQSVSLGCIPGLLHTEVDAVTQVMPPCMSHLHRTLRLKHRLRHHSRIQYTLFLKEAGLSVHESLFFWRNEYSQLPGNHSGCSHDWRKNESRYTYSIRHLYGLEGSRTNYRAHSCTALQDSCHGAEDGGCPFSHFDMEHLLSLLHHEGIRSNQDDILGLVAKGQYSDACSLFFWQKTKDLLAQSSSCQQCSIQPEQESRSNKCVADTSRRNVIPPRMTPENNQCEVDTCSCSVKPPNNIRSIDPSSCEQSDAEESSITIDFEETNKNYRTTEMCMDEAITEDSCSNSSCSEADICDCVKASQISNSTHRHNPLVNVKDGQNLQMNSTDRRNIYTKSTERKYLNIHNTNPQTMCINDESSNWGTDCVITNGTNHRTESKSVIDSEPVRMHINSSNLPAHNLQQQGSSTCSIRHVLKPTSTLCTEDLSDRKGVKCICEKDMGGMGSRIVLEKQTFTKPIHYMESYRRLLDSLGDAREHSEK